MWGLQPLAWLKKKSLILKDRLLQIPPPDLGPRMVARSSGATRSTASQTTSARAGGDEGFELISVSSGEDEQVLRDWKRIVIHAISLGKIRSYWSEVGRWLNVIKKLGQLAIQDIKDDDARRSRQKARGSRADQRRAGPGGSSSAGASGSASRGSRARRLRRRSRGRGGRGSRCAEPACGPGVGGRVDSL